MSLNSFIEQLLVDAAAGRSVFKLPVRTRAASNEALSGLRTIGGVAMEEGQYALLTAQTVGSQNGIWTVSRGAWSRRSDTDTSEKVRPGTTVYVEEGDSATTWWTVTTSGNIELGSTALSFASIINSLALTAAAALAIAQAGLAGSSGEAARADHVHAHGAQPIGDGTNHALAIASGASGFISGSDKQKLDGITAGAAVASVGGNPPISITGTAANPVVNIASASATTPGAMSVAHYNLVDGATVVATPDRLVRRDASNASVLAAHFATSALNKSTAGTLRCAYGEIAISFRNVANTGNFIGISHQVDDKVQIGGNANCFGVVAAAAAGGSFDVQIGGSGSSFKVESTNTAISTDNVEVTIGTVGGFSVKHVSTERLIINQDGIGFFGAFAVPQASNIGAINDLSGGTADGDVDDVGAVYSQATLNNNFAEVVAKLNAINAVLEAYGLIAT